jgi:hypothetical protein
LETIRLWNHHRFAILSSIITQVSLYIISLRLPYMLGSVASAVWPILVLSFLDYQCDNIPISRPLVSNISCCYTCWVASIKLHSYRYELERTCKFFVTFEKISFHASRLCSD